MYLKTRGIVIKETKVGENDKFLTVFSEDFGKISVKARGVRKTGTRFGSARFLCWSEMTLYKGKNGYSLNECSLISGFHNISSNIETLYLASYFAEILCTITREKLPDKRLLSLFLNALYLIDKEALPLLQIKAVFELRCACFMGYTPALDSCIYCGDQNELIFSPKEGGLVCKNCSSDGIIISESVLNALRFISYSYDKKIFSFKCSKDILYKISNICEEYLLCYVENTPKSLNLFKEIFT